MSGSLTIVGLGPGRAGADDARRRPGAARGDRSRRLRRLSRPRCPTWSCRPAPARLRQPRRDRARAPRIAARGRGAERRRRLRRRSRACSPWRQPCSRRSRRAKRLGARSTFVSSRASRRCSPLPRRPARRSAATSAPSRSRTISNRGRRSRGGSKPPPRGDFVIALYNPASRARPHQLGEAFGLLRQWKPRERVVVFARAAGTAEARLEVTTLGDADALAGRHAHARSHRRRARRG